MRKNKAGFKRNGFSMFALDDDASITAALQAFFEAAGFQVDTENDPLKGLERMRQKHYDILLLDFLMQPLCGDQVVSRLREFDRDIFIILLTGHKELAPPMNTMRELDIQAYYEKSDRFDQLELLVESCIKSIRQMRIIRDYRDGLSLILSASPRIHRLAPLSDIMEQVLAQASELTQTKGLFVWVDPNSTMRDCKEGPSNYAGGLYRGFGHYSVPPEEFHRSILPGLIAPIEDAMRERTIRSVQGFVIAPLHSAEARPFGVLVVDALSNATDDLIRLLEMYAHQSASALSNAVLHEMVQEKNNALTEAYGRIHNDYMETVSMLRLLVDAKDIYTRGHSDRVSHYAGLIAKEIGLDEQKQERVRVAGLFHDVGKVGVPEMILTKEGSLDNWEFVQIKKHPSVGSRILSSMAMFTGLAEIVCAHHERYDGKGYPDHLSKDSIPLEARIITVADAFDAMTSDRHYRKSLGYGRAIEELRAGSGTQFDPVLVEAFQGILERDLDKIQDDISWTHEREES